MASRMSAPSASASRARQTPSAIISPATALASAERDSNQRQRTRKLERPRVAPPPVSGIVPRFRQKRSITTEATHAHPATKEIRVTMDPVHPNFEIVLETVHI